MRSPSGGQSATPDAKFARLRVAALLVLPVLLTISTIGCKEGRTKTFKVTGTVTYKNKPVEGATVMFMPKGNKPAQGVTDASGRFELSTFGDKDGAVAGLHAVSIVKSVQKNPKDTSPYASADSVNVLPAKYGNPAQSPLTATVAGGGSDDFPFDLTD